MKKRTLLLPLIWLLSSLTSLLEAQFISNLEPLTFIKQPAHAGIRPDSAWLQALPLNPASDWLMFVMPVNPKIYGHGMSSSPSIRGLGAENTGLWWNGVPMNNPGLGLSDMSLLFLSGTQPEIINGMMPGSGISGGMGGNVIFNSPSPKKSMRIDMGTTGRLGLMAQSGVAKPKEFWSFSAFGFYDHGKFRYPDPYQNGKPLVYTEENHQYQIQCQGGMGKKLARNWDFKYFFWLTHADRHLQKAAGSVIPQQQKDQAFRNVISFSHQGKTWSFSMLMASLLDGISYENPGLKTKARFNTAYGQIQAFRKWGNGILWLQGEWRHMSAHGMNYAQKATNTWHSAWMKYTLPVGKKIRFDFFHSLSYALPHRWVSSGGLYFSVLSKKWNTPPLLDFKIQHGTRLPTLNEQYFYPGGNPEILPEKGYFLELAFPRQISFSRQIWQFKPVIFIQQVNQKIQWQPDALGYFSPVNMGQLSGPGWEFSGSWTLRLPHAQLSCRGYTTGLYPNVKNNSGEKVHLIYTPFNQSGLLAAWQNVKTYFWIGYHYTGFRFIQKDGSDWLPEISLVSAGGQIRLPGKRIKHLALTISNVLNQPYHWVKNYPMPGIQLQLQLQFIL